MGKWKEYRLGDLFERVTRKNSNLESQNVLTISAQYGLINQEEFFNKSLAGKNLKNYYLLKEGEFAYNKSYSAGYPVGATKMLSRYNKGIVSTLYICFKSKSDLVYNKYFEYYFESKQYYDELYKIAQEGARNHGLLNVNAEDFFNIKIKIPSYKEQIKISRILCMVDEIKSKLDIEIIELKKQSQGIIKKLLANVDYEEIKSISELFEEIRGKGLSKSDLIENGSFECVLYGELFTTYNEIIDNIKSRTNKDEGTFSKCGDLLFPASTTTCAEDLAKCSTINKDNIRLGGDINILRKKQELNSEFMAYYFNNIKKKEISEIGQGTTIVHLYAKELAKIKIEIYNAEIQNEIASIMKKIDRKITLLKNKKSKYDFVKQYLMQKLLTGKVRVKI